MVAFGGVDPRNGTLKDAEVIRGIGRILTNDSTNNKLIENTATSISIGVSAGESSRDPEHVFETASATVAFFPLGGVLMVQSEASKTYTTGCLVYAKANGLASPTANSSKVLGVYVGEGQATGSALLATGNDSTLTEGELIPVMTAGAATA
tara:strand:- start:3855 stop:4307 length:453 start_codon:yes stop_codon:yes gene_type:complete